MKPITKPNTTWQEGTWYWVSLPFATGLVLMYRGRITVASPIMDWMTRADPTKVKDWVTRKGGIIKPLEG